jgi:predicted metalloprotease with PDZ domain
VGGEHRPYAVSLSLPGSWEKSATGLEADGPHHFRAKDYEQLCDCPIAAGNFDVREFDSGGSRHQIVTLGELGTWDPARPPADLAKLAAENQRMWGDLPFKHYVFLLNIHPGGGGLEHMNSTLITTSPNSMKDDRSYAGWLSLVGHEYFHAFNVKRLRPVELGPFDYENPPRTPSLWISEGLTTYYGELIVCRAGLVKAEGFLQSLSSHISQLQNGPGRLVQSLEESSLNVWTNSRSGVQTDDKTTVSYYVKGPVAGFLLDARVRKATNGAKSLDDVMRLAYQRYSGEKGFTPQEFVAVASEVAGADQSEWYKHTIASAEELDYSEALDWFGLRFAKTEDGKASWKLEVREDASEPQKAQMRDWLKASK